MIHSQPGTTAGRWWAITGGALQLAVWGLFVAVVLTRRPVVDAALAAGGQVVRPGLEDLAGTSALVFLGLGFGVLILGLLSVARYADVLLARAGHRPVRTVRFHRCTVLVGLGVAFTGDLLRDDPVQSLGSAVPALLGTIVAGLLWWPLVPVIAGGRRRLALFGTGALLGTASLTFLGASLWSTT